MKKRIKKIDLRFKNGAKVLYVLKVQLYYDLHNS